ncbi:MAG TPA: MarR family transcriptional regulator [Ktedonobacterales bacterium]
MIDIASLTTEQREFIESLGVYFEHYGGPRLMGRLMALLMLADRALTLDDMAQSLLVSRASISTNIRFAVSAGLVVRAGVAGDRRDFYRYNDNVWVQRTRQVLEASRASRALAERGLAVIDADDTHARERLEEMLEYCDFSIEETLRMEQRWIERRRAHRAAVAAKREAARALAKRPTNHDDITSAGVSDGGLTIQRED